MANLRVICVNGTVIDFNNVLNVRKLDNVITFEYRKNENEIYKEAYFNKNHVIGFYEFEIKGE